MKIPLVHTQDGRVYTAPGFEHGRIYAPLNGPPVGEITQGMQPPQQEQKRKGDKKDLLRELMGITCCLGISVCCLAACILPCVCHL